MRRIFPCQELKKTLVYDLDTRKLTITYIVEGKRYVETWTVAPAINPFK